MQEKRSHVAYQEDPWSTIKESPVEFLMCSVVGPRVEKFSARGRHYRGQTGSVQLRGVRARNGVHTRVSRTGFRGVEERDGRRLFNCTQSHAVPALVPFLSHSFSLSLPHLLLCPSRVSFRPAHANLFFFFPSYHDTILRSTLCKRDRCFIYTRISVAYRRSAGSDKKDRELFFHDGRNKIYHKYVLRR